MLRRLLVPICFALVCAACSGGGEATGPGTGTPVSTAPTDPLVVQTDLGAVKGAASARSGVRAFLGLPYAAPPTGANRWRPPQPRAPYEGERDATVNGASCPHNVGSSTARFLVTPPPDEDCLTLSVWAPDRAEKLPVLFWIHGGGLRAGSAHQPYYTGDQLAAKGMVVVGVNYRLGAFGFLASEELASESGDGSVGNYGLADQTAGMEWVKRNAAAFGGDPGNVTIVGESAGGGSVCAHLASPQSRGLFHRAVIQSGGGCDRLAGLETGYASGAQLFERLGCADIACLRAKPTEDIIATGLSGNFVNDGVRLAQTGREAAAKGELDGVTVITGSNAEEAFLFTVSEEEPSEERLNQMFGQLTDDPAALLGLYPPERYPSRLARYREMYTEAAFTCPTLAFAQAARNDVYVYHFVFRSTDDRWAAIGPTHGVELAFLFGHPEGVTDSRPGLEGREATVSAFMQDSWSSFVKTGTPGDASAWRRYRDGGKVTIIDDAPKVVDQIREGRCEAVDRLTASRRTPL